MRREANFFDDQQELDLVYMSRRLREALKVEKLFTDAGIDYLVETGTYVGGLLIKRDLTGAFFYVAAADLGAARKLLTDSGYRPYQVS